MTENTTWENMIENVTTDNEGASEVQPTNPDESQRVQFPVPDAIYRMMNNGVHFSTTKNSWNLNNDNVSLEKPYSVYFML